MSVSVQTATFDSGALLDALHGQNPGVGALVSACGFGPQPAAEHLPARQPSARAALERGDLVAVLPDWQHKTSYAGTAWLLYPPNRFLPAKLRVWIDHLVLGFAGVE